MENNCTCDYRDELPGVGPYCEKWFGYEPFCYLSGGPEGRWCPGSAKSALGDFYATENQGVCLRSKGKFTIYAYLSTNTYAKLAIIPNYTVRRRTLFACLNLNI